MATVIFKGLTIIQANSLAILAESGKISDVLNRYMDEIGVGESSVDPDPFIIFDESKYNPEHEVDFD